MPDTAPTTDPVTDELAALDTERADIEAAVDRDPYRAADDLPAWHGRENRRRERLVEIEARRRDLEEWGALVLTHRDAVTRYQATARPIARRFARLTEHRTWRRDSGGLGQDRDTGTATRAITDWWRALAAFARSLDLDDEQARRVLVRETDAWVDLRNATLQAEVIWAGYDVPVPEAGIDGELPGWIRIGAHRTDRAPAQ